MIHTNGEEEEEAEEVAVAAAPMMMPAAGFQMPAMASMPMMSAGKAGGIKITFKKAKISIDRMVISEKK